MSNKKQAISHWWSYLLVHEKVQIYVSVVKRALASTWHILQTSFSGETPAGIKLIEEKCLSYLQQIQRTWQLNPIDRLTKLGHDHLVVSEWSVYIQHALTNPSWIIQTWKRKHVRNLVLRTVYGFWPLSKRRSGYKVLREIMCFPSVSLL